MNDEIAAAERRQAEARARLTQSLQLVQERLKPASLARDARVRLTDAAGEGVEAVRRQPLPLIGAGVAAGLFFGRHRLAGLFRRKKKKLFR